MTLGVQDYLANQVATRADVLAITDSTGVALTYRGLDVASDEVIALLKNAGVQSADRVLLLSENCAAAVAVLFACWKMGVRAVPVNARQTETEVARVKQHAKPAAMFMTTSVSGDAQKHANRYDAVEVSGSFGTLHMATPLGSAPDDEGDVAVLLYTTGTTGDPKGVMKSPCLRCRGRQYSGF